MLLLVIPFLFIKTLALYQDALSKFNKELYPKAVNPIMNEIITVLLKTIVL